MEIYPTIQLLQDIVSLDYPLYYWIYTSAGETLHTNCPPKHVKMMDWLWRHTDCLETARKGDCGRPILLRKGSDLTWVAVWRCSKENTLAELHVLGPCFPYGAPLSAELHASLEQSNASPGLRQKLYATMEAIPVVSRQVIQQYALMLDFCVNNRRSTSQDLQHLGKTLSESSEHFPRRRDYQVERSLLAAVREGAPDYRQAKSVTDRHFQSPPYVSDPLLQKQIALTIFTSLCVRATIEGGISPDVSYCVGDTYIQRIFSAKRTAELGQISDEMYQAFVEMSYRHQQNPKISKVVQEVCDYIKLHPSHELSLDSLAKEFGYTKYYLSRRFSEEIHCSLQNYIYIVRIECAKQYLEASKKSISQIAAHLQFSSPSHFSTVFRKITGMSPAEYRSKQ